MALVDQFDQAGAVDVRIDLGGRDIGVAEQGLQSPEVGPARQQVRREGVAKDVGADPIRSDTRVGGQRAHDLE